MVAKKLLITFHPDLAKQIRVKQDFEFDINTLGSSSRLKIWWHGDCGHEWPAEVVARVSGKGCRICNGPAVEKGFNDLESVYPELAKEWHPTLNGGKRPSEFRSKSGELVWWLGPCGHSFDARIGERVRGIVLRPHTTGCPTCLNRNFIPGVNDLATRRPDLAKEFHSQLNGGLDPQVDKLLTNKKYVWICEIGHEFEQKLGNRLNQKQGCPVCKNKRVQRGVNDLESLAPQYLSEWDHKKNVPLKPSDVGVGSNKKVWWICRFSHQWPARVVKREAGQQCPTCMNRRLKPGFNDLLTKQPLVASTWDLRKNDGLEPSEVLAGTHEKFWWICEDGHSWETAPATRVRTGCPRCARAGYDQTKPGELYFIEHRELRAKKIGIANQGSDRIRNWRKLGWQVHYHVKEDDGLIIQEIETRALRWIRKDCNLPPFLGAEEMGRFGGASETFSAEALANVVVIEKIKQLRSSFGVSKKRGKSQ